MTLTDKPLPFSIDDILKYEKSKASIYPTLTSRSYSLAPLLSASYLPYSSATKHSCSEHRSTPCNSSVHHCHLSTLQLNSSYPNLETFIHHRRCRRTRTVFSGNVRTLALKSTPSSLSRSQMLNCSVWKNVSKLRSISRHRTASN